MSDDLEWLDDDPTSDGPAAAEDEITAGRRSPMRRRTKIVLGAVGVVAIAAAVTAGVSGSDGDRRTTAEPSRTVTLSPRSAVPATDVAVSPGVVRYGPPSKAVAAIKQAFPGVSVDSYVTVAARGTDGRPTDFYNLSSAGRRITVTVSPQRHGDYEGVSRTATSVEIAQGLGRGSRVAVKVVRTPGPTTQRDFEGVQALVQDGRILAGRDTGQ